MSDEKKEPIDVAKEAIDGEIEPAKVGYKKPPVRTRFKRGQSGNPSGRPKKKSPEYVEVTRNLLNEKTIVKDRDGSTRRVTLYQAVLMGQIQSSIKGNTRAAAFVMERAELSNAGSGKDLPLIVKLLDSELSKAEEDDDDEDD